MSSQLQVCEPRGWYPVFSPAMHRRDRRIKQPGDRAGATHGLDEFVGIGFHNPMYATVANFPQDLVCDNRLCDSRGSAVEEGMDRDSIVAWMEARGLNNRQLAIMLGISEDKVSKSLATKGKPRQWQGPEVLKLIELMRGSPDPIVRTEVRGTGLSAEELQGSMGVPETKPIPLLGSAFGGDWERFAGVELTELHLSEVLDYIARPPSLRNEPEAYSVEIIGESMSPRFEPGERAFVAPRSPVHSGHDVVVQITDPDADGDEARRVKLVLIKKLVKRTATHLVLHQYNPEQTFEVPIKCVATDADGRLAIHRVRGRL